MEGSAHISRDTDGLNTTPLTSLRFFAALGVFIYHYPLITWAPNWTQRLSIDGGTFVTLFFILSGLILTRVYRKTEWTSANIKSYALKRLARVAPVYYLSLIAGIPLMVGMLHNSPMMTEKVTLLRWICLHLLGLMWIEPNSAFALHLNPPSWSLGVEIGFYTTFPFLVHFAKNRLTSSRQILICIGITAAIYMLKFWIFSMFKLPDTSPGLSTFSYFQIGNPLVRLPEFFVGVLLALYLETKLHWAGRGSLVFSIAVALFLSSSIWPTYISNAVSFMAMVLLLGSALLLGPIAASAMSQPWLEKLGHASFAFYLIHMPLVFLLTFVLRKTLHIQLPNIAYLVICQAFSILIFDWYETPLRRTLITRFSTRSKAV